jgi:hypothetical protein
VPPLLENYMSYLGDLSSERESFILTQWLSTMDGKKSKHLSIGAKP